LRDSSSRVIGEQAEERINALALRHCDLRPIRPATPASGCVLGTLFARSRNQPIGSAIVFSIAAMFSSR
jgi:hypothetical protein